MSEWVEEKAQLKVSRCEREYERKCSRMTEREGEHE